MTVQALSAGVAMPAMNNLVARNIDPARKATALGGCYTGFHTGAVRCRCIGAESVSCC